jgi:hypothetical protein
MTLKRRCFEFQVEFADRPHLERLIALLFKELLRRYDGRMRRARELPGEPPESTPERRGGRGEAESIGSEKKACEQS